MWDFPVRDVMALQPPGAWPGDKISRRSASQQPELGCLFIPLEPRTPCVFPANPARSLHAALLKRLEAVDSVLSQRLHASPPGAHSLERPWTGSALLGPLQTGENGVEALPGQLYWVRVTALQREMVEGLRRAFDQPPFRQKPLHLEGVPFQVVSGAPLWTAYATYQSLVNAATVDENLCLEAISPVTFSGRRQGQLVPEPRLCLLGYLRRWNAFAPRPIPEQPLLEYVERSLTVTAASVRGVSIDFGGFTRAGAIGRWEWQATGGASPWLRAVNLLANYSFFCGTGAMTTMGLGQTVRAMP